MIIIGQSADRQRTARTSQQSKHNSTLLVWEMSVADVCELESILKCEADEKVALEKKIYELEKQCKTVEKNCGREAEEGVKIDREQQHLCKQVQDGAERFEMLSLQLSGIKTESSSDVESSDYYVRFLRYMAARTAMHDDILLVTRETACLQEKHRLREVHRANDQTVKKFADLRAATDEKENTLNSLQNFDWTTLEHTVAEKQKRLDDLSHDTAELQRSDVEDKRKEVDDSIAALDVRAAAERNDVGNALESAKTTTAAVAARLKQREAILDSIQKELIAAKVDCDASSDALTDAQQHHDALTGKSAQLKEDESRAESALKDATTKLGEARNLEKARRAEEEFLTRQLSFVQLGDTDIEENRAPSVESATLQAALEAQRAVVESIERDIAALTAQPDDVPVDLRDIAEERERLEARLNKARADITERAREKDELEASGSTRSRLASEAVREQNELAATSDRLLVEVQGLQARVQAIVDQIETVPASSRAASDSSAELDEKLKDLERQHALVEASLRRAEDKRAKDESEPSQQLQELDTARARRYIADSYAERQKESQALVESIAAADREFQSLVKEGERALKAEQSKLKGVMDGIEARRRQSLAQVEAVEKEIEALGGADELAALGGSFSEEKSSTSAAPTLPPHAGAVSQGNHGNQGTPPEDSWATSAPAQFGSNFASGLEDEGEELREAQRLRELEVATKKPTAADITKGRGRGRQRA